MARRITIVVLLIAASLLQESCHPRTSDRVPGGGASEYSGAGFAVSCPRGVEVARSAPVSDFDIYTFGYAGRILLTAYAGNQPNFVYEGPTIRSKSQGAINELPFVRVSIQDTGGPVRTEVLILLSARRSWPKYLHFAYRDLPASLQDVAEAIIGSVRYQEAGGIHNPMENMDNSSRPFPPFNPTIESVEREIQEKLQQLKAIEDSGGDVDEEAKSQLELLNQRVEWLKKIRDGWQERPPISGDETPKDQGNGSDP